MMTRVEAAVLRAVPEEVRAVVFERVPRDFPFCVRAALLIAEQTGLCPTLVLANLHQVARQYNNEVREMALPESSIDIIIHPGAKRLSIRENMTPDGIPWEVPCDPTTTSVLLAALRSGKGFIVTEVNVDVDHPNGACATKVELVFLDARPHAEVVPSGRKGE